MALNQVYFSTMVNFNARITTGVTNTDGTGSLTTPTWWSTTTSAGVVPTTDYMLSGLVITASSATGVGDPADSILQCYAINKASSAEIRKFYTLDLGNPAAGSTNAGEYQIYVPFGPSYTFMANTDLRFSLSVTTTAGNIDIFGIVMVA